MEQKVIFFDIDGTLLNHEKELPASTKESVFKLKEMGHIVAIATGRAPFMFAGLREELGIDSYVSFNGQYVVLNGEVVYRNSLDKASLLKLTETAMENEHPVVYMDHEDMKANVPEHPHIDESIGTMKLDVHPTHDPDYHVGRELYQTLLFCEEKEEQKYVEQFKDFDFVRWHPVSTDILPKGGSKAIGIEKIVSKLGFAKEQVYAFGDGLNDVEMLTEVHNSIAMGNGVEEAKSAARIVTQSVEDDGIYHGLKKAGLL